MKSTAYSIFQLQAVSTPNTILPPQSILSRSLIEDENLKCILFQFAEGQELSEHTAAMPALIHILDGQFDCVIAGDSLIAEPGNLIYMQPNTPHSLKAKKTASFYLMMLK
jgi:quercetin dioxygenase-like cupin family protein